MSTLIISGLERVFRFQNNGTTVKLSDPDPERTPEQVMQLYANQYPSLTTASVVGPAFDKDKAVYEFKTTMGTKG
jgi:PRTRC genetic system protein C